MRVEFVLVLLGDEHKHNDEERKQSYRSPGATEKGLRRLVAAPSVLAIRLTPIHAATLSTKEHKKPGPGR